MRTPLSMIGPGIGPAREHALLVEHAVVRQVDLVARGRDLAALEQQVGIVELAVFDPGRADQHGRAASRGLARERLDGRAAGRLERRLEHEVLGHIAGDEQLGKDDQVGALPGRGGARAAHFLGIAGDVADSRIELRERDGEAVGGAGVHGTDVAMPSRSPQHGQIKPTHWASASSQVKPAIASATPTAAELMSLIRPMSGWCAGVT